MKKTQDDYFLEIRKAINFQIEIKNRAVIVFFENGDKLQAFYEYYQTEKQKAPLNINDPKTGRRMAEV